MSVDRAIQRPVSARSNATALATSRGVPKSHGMRLFERREAFRREQLPHLSFASSTASDLAKPINAALVALYTETIDVPTRPMTEERNTMPLPVA